MAYQQDLEGMIERKDKDIEAYKDKLKLSRTKIEQLDQELKVSRDVNAQLMYAKEMALVEVLASKIAKGSNNG